MDGTTQVGGIEATTAAAFCYLPIPPLSALASVVLLATEPKDHTFVRFHALQGLLWSVLTFGIANVITLRYEWNGVAIALHPLWILSAWMIVDGLRTAYAALSGEERELAFVAPYARRWGG